MDPNEDIIDLLYNKSSTDDLYSESTQDIGVSRKGTLQRQSSVTVNNYGFAYPHPPSRNYYEDLYQIQRRNFHGSESVYGNKKTLCRTDSSQIQGSVFSFPSPSRQEKLRRSQRYGSLRQQRSEHASKISPEESIDEEFYTPEVEDKVLIRSVRKDIIHKDEEYPEILAKRKGTFLVELPNGVRQKRLPLHDVLAPVKSQSDTGGNVIYSSIDSAMEEDIAKKPNDTVEESSLKTTAPSLKIAMDVKWGPYFQSGNTIVGLIVMVYLTNQWSNYLQTLHENDMWFSNIKEVEREISFRTEQGFYYSYFKHLIKAPSLSQGISELEKENTTEHPNTINAWKRFNIYQELFLASLHRLYSFNMEPILFYVEVVFSLQGFHAAMLFLISWKLSGTWVSGVLTIFLLFPHRSEITRVSYTVPLREHFSLPFFYAMVVSVARLLEISHSPSNKRKTNSSTLWNSSEFSLVQIFVMTFVFTITWQFAQFALLLHSFALYVLSSAQLLNKDTVCRIFGVQFLAILLVWYFQYYQPMVIISLTVSFLPLAVMSLQSQVHNAGLVRSQTIFKNIVALVVRATLVIIAMVALNMTIKSVMNQTADNHIFQFVASWMGFQDETDFDTRLYRCLSVFRPLSYASYKALASNLALPLYFAYIVLQLVIMWLTIIKKWYFKEKAEDCVELKDEQPSMSLFEKPVIKRRRETPSHKSNKKKAMEPRSAEVEAETGNELWSLESEPATIYISGISAVFALLGMLMLRMIVFWSPFILIFASASICDKKLWTALLNKISPSTDNKIIVSMLRHLVLLFALVVIYLSHKEAILAHLDELREFWDPDTVDLMEWISQKTPKTAAFSGTMQLMAGVKLCTLRPITNHPHFEDKDLRLRTRELYKMYGQMGPEEVYEALVKYNASYIILEDSQCLGAGRSPDRCAMPDTVDLTYGHIPADGKRDPPHLIQSKYPRFCDEIRYGSPSYTKFFRLAFHNKTFRVYQVKPWKGNFSN